MKCPKCNGEMDEGLQIDASSRTWGGAKKAQWVKGKTLPVIKRRLIPPGVEITGERYYLAVYRCRSCGFLESYAQERA